MRRLYCVPMLRVCRFIWALPATILGMALALLALRHGRLRVVDGVLEAHGPWLARLLSTVVPIAGGAAAMTFGHVVIGRDEPSLELTRAHERVHVRQYERWGVLFFPAYAVASVYAVLSGGDYYRDNVFERAAFDSVRRH